MVIREYNKSDWNVVLDIFARAKPDEFKGLVAKEDIVSLDNDEGLLNSFNNSIIYVAEQDNKIVGYAGYHKYLVSFLFIDPDFYRQGIATQLLQHLLPLIGNKAWLLVVKANAPAITLYIKYGFQIAEEFNGKYNGKIPVTVLRLAIEPALRSWKPQ